eukprot:gnl/TRDRNA2_/TRDRNA2_129525_c0_seq2.p1 gnl/TRDRNA2_/TRDRNA2_129525_c0~~gnl/TRDRNA2_/TRDRNA2_129525_c0_seq2.p1  ORF type:complete len:290 (-),score=57.03 gnl/TRDRNA2_/TRDRNA2_129525_c0_seq2:78-947(-)
MPHRPDKDKFAEEEQRQLDVSAAFFEQQFREVNPHTIVFLDVDGVLASHHASQQAVSQEERLDPRALHRLGSVLHATGAYVVLSTSWRAKDSLKQILVRALERNAGLKFGRVVGETPIYSFEKRPQEIREWLERHPSIQAWAAVDDVDLEASAPDLFGGHFVCTDPFAGLTGDDAVRLMQVLQAQVAAPADAAQDKSSPSPMALSPQPTAGGASLMGRMHDLEEKRRCAERPGDGEARRRSLERVRAPPWEAFGGASAAARLQLEQQQQQPLRPGPSGYQEIDRRHPSK